MPDKMNIPDAMSPNNDDIFFQPLSLTDTLNRAWTIYRLGFKTFNTINAITLGSLILSWATLLLILVPAFGLDPTNQSAEYKQDNAPLFIILYLLELAVTLPFGVVGHAAMMRASADLYLQRTLSLQVCFNAACELYFSNLMVSVLFAMGVSLGFVLFVVPGIYIGIMWIVAHAAIVIGK